MARRTARNHPEGPAGAPERRAPASRRPPHPVDAHVGRRIRRRRLSLGLTQGELAEALGLSFQQVQKYELGSNRVSASRLFMLAQALGKRVAWFFESYGDLGEEAEPAPEDGRSGGREADELVLACYRMPPDVRRLLLALARKLGDGRLPLRGDAPASPSERP